MAGPEVPLPTAQWKPVGAQNITVALNTRRYDHVPETGPHDLGRGGEQAARAGVAGRVHHHVMVTHERDSVIETADLPELRPHGMYIRINTRQALTHRAGFSQADVLNSGEVPDDVAWPETLPVAQRQLPHA